MGTIACVVNGPSRTITVNSISGMNPQNTWARFEGPFFEIAGGGIFHLVFTAPYSEFEFFTSDPIDWGPNGKPDWIEIQEGTTAQTLTLLADSSHEESRDFTIRDAGGGDPIVITLKSAGGSGGNGGTIGIYLQDDRTALIGPLPEGMLAAGRQLAFGFRDSGVQQVFFMPGTDTVIQGLVWSAAMPDYIQMTQTAGQATISVYNPGPAQGRLHASFSIQTTDGTIDPTIVTNPDESAP